MSMMTTWPTETEARYIPVSKTPELIRIRSAGLEPFAKMGQFAWLKPIDFSELRLDQIVRVKLRRCPRDPEYLIEKPFIARVSMVHPSGTCAAFVQYQPHVALTLCECDVEALDVLDLLDVNPSRMDAAC